MWSMSGKCLGKSADMDGMETASPSSEIYWEMELSTCSKKGVANAAEEGEEDAMAMGIRWDMEYGMHRKCEMKCWRFEFFCVYRNM